MRTRQVVGEQADGVEGFVELLYRACCALESAVWAHYDALEGLMLASMHKAVRRITGDDYYALPDHDGIRSPAKH